MKKNLLAGLIAGLFASAAYAFNPFVVKDIRVEGIQRTEAGTVFSYLPVKVGDTLDDEKASQAIKALFATGFFKDVRIEIDKDVMVVVVEERPAISQVDFVGMKEFDKDTIRKAFKDIGLAESRIFDRAIMEKAAQELKRQYLSRGRYSANITTTVTPLERNRVSINFNVDEGEAAKIKQINIVGNKVFKEKELLDLFQLRTPNWLTWYTKNDQYSKQKLSADLESLRSFYQNQGYLDFNVESTQVSITPDKKDIYITVSLSEGERYMVSAVKVAGILPIPDEEFHKLVTVKPGDVFSREKLNDSIKAITDRLGNDGYAFANVNAAPDIDKEKRLVAFTLFVDPGKRVYVRHVNIAGNSKTKDEVIRREVRQMEGGWYDAQKVSLSRERIDKLGYFSDVTVETPPVPGTSDQVDANYAVTEKPTGSLMLGAGFSSSDKVILSGSISQANLFGSGKNVSVQLNTSHASRTIGLSYTDPYFTVDGISQGFDIYHRTYDPSQSYSYTQSYKTVSTGGGLRWGVPIAEKESISFGVAVDRTEVTTFDDSRQVYKDFVSEFGNTNSTFSGNVGWGRDTKDSYIYPTRGGVARAGIEATVPGGTLRYYKLNLQRQQYFPLTKNLTLMLNGEFGAGNGYGGRPLPFFKSFYAGGVTSVRGYDTYTLGPKQDGEAIGGTKRVVMNAEVLFPMPGLGKDKSARIGWFVDAGQVFGPKDDFGRYSKFSVGDLRYSTGLSLAWSSPLGPLRFSIANPLNKKDDDRTQRFQFTMGTVF
ncbi:outer membrane protein assembly factor BamA [Azospira inquinata]|uniref:Outer membrane protein assembly factor BamA n=1 Tax=Azospira inquinata TaxID=2785627 RepID=A0A975SN14_9RHOO|nr:outer membrane protein assembly factor BamA [Azospira inquinata]QWT45598.1 outer membrane protein assembly factor BamA [Azospira inquinata]QWT49076.1 outer membrane protein assembly factor BamA [Azospira inquinata]